MKASHSSLSNHNTTTSMEYLLHNVSEAIESIAPASPTEMFLREKEPKGKIVRHPGKAATKISAEIACDWTYIDTVPAIPTTNFPAEIGNYNSKTASPCNNDQQHCKLCF